MERPSFISLDASQKIRLHLVVQPKAKRTAFLCLHDTMVKLGVAAPPVDGKANRKVIAYIADFFGLKKNDIKIISGERSRKKVCLLDNISEEEVRRKLSSLFEL